MLYYIINCDGTEVYKAVSYNRLWKLLIDKCIMKIKMRKSAGISTSVKLISGRCSPDYSYGITDPHKDVQKTGEAVKFCVRKPPTLKKDDVLKGIEFDENWITILE